MADGAAPRLGHVAPAAPHPPLDLGGECLARRLAGEVLRPGEDAYEAARQVFNAAVDRSELVLRLHSVTDALAGMALWRDERTRRFNENIPPAPDGDAV